MYWNNKQGGHNAGPVGAPAHTWYLAEGATSDFFSTFILLVNANNSATNVTVSLLKDDGTRTDLPYTLGANSRKTVFVNDGGTFQYRGDGQFRGKRTLRWDYRVPRLVSEVGMTVGVG